MLRRSTCFAVILGLRARYRIPCRRLCTAAGWYEVRHRTIKGVRVFDPKKDSFTFEDRAQLIYALMEAAALEHLLMCQYIFAAASLKTHISKLGDSERRYHQLERIRYWKRKLYEVAREEMQHLAIAMNLLIAVGGAPTSRAQISPQRTSTTRPKMRTARSTRSRCRSSDSLAPTTIPFARLIDSSALNILRSRLGCLPFFRYRRDVGLLLWDLMAACRTDKLGTVRPRSHMGSKWTAQQ